MPFRQKKTLQQVFDNHYVPDPFSGCWLWTNALEWNGYARAYYKGVEEAGHRVSWKLYYGEIPNDLFVLHKCDVRHCVNPDHLFLGTKSDNTQDCIRKGRLRPGHPKGEINGKAKLTEAEVLAVRASPVASRPLARSLGVSKTCILFIRRRRTWTHI